MGATQPNRLKKYKPLKKLTGLNKIREISFETLKKWKWLNRDGYVVSTTKRPSDGKEFTRHYGNCIGYMMRWATQGRFPHSDGWIYFTINTRKYKTKLYPKELNKTVNSG